MILANIIEKAFQKGHISTRLEKMIEDVLWSPELDQDDCEAVKQLVDALEKGVITTEQKITEDDQNSDLDENCISFFSSSFLNMNTVKSNLLICH